MKTSKNAIIGTVIAGACMWAAAGCSHPQIQAQAQRTDTGPSVINPRATSDLIQLNQNLKVAQAPEVLAEVKDLQSNIDSVVLKVAPVPQEPQVGLGNFQRQAIEVPMRHMGGSTWGARLSDEDLRRLAINGQDVTYRGRVIAKAKDGTITASDKQVEFTITAPEIVEGS